MKTLRLAVYLAFAAAAVLGVSACRNPDVVKREHVRKGDELLAAKQYDAAMFEYRLALHTDPKYGEAHYKLAEALATTDSLPAALGEYVRAADLLPEDVDLQIKTGTLLLVARRYEDAKTRARMILQRDANSVPGLILMGNALAALQDLDNAIAVTKRAAELDPDRAGAQTNLGVLELAKGDRRQAEETFKRAIAVNPKAISPRLALGNFYSSAGQYAEAERALKEALAVDPKNLRVNRALGLLCIDAGRVLDARPYLQTAAEVEATPEAWISLADYYIGVGLSKEALEILNRVPPDSPSYSPAALRVVLVTYASGQHEEGLRILHEIQAREPHNPIPHAFEARLLLSEHSTAQALQAAKDALAIDPSSAQANLMLGKVQIARGMIDEAQNALTAAVRSDPTLVDAHLELARLHMQRAELDTSISYAEQSVKYGAERLDTHLSLVRSLIARPETLPRGERELRALLASYPKSPDVQVVMGVLMMQKENFASARPYFERALALDPRSIDALNGLTALDAKANRTSDAAARIDAQLAKAPKDPALLLLAAKFYGLQGDRPRTEALLKRLIAADPAGLDGYNLLGQLYVTGHQLEQAKAQFEAMAQREPQSEMAVAMLGLLNQAQGNQSEAESWYLKALEINPRGVLASNNLAWIYAINRTKLDEGLQLARRAWAQMPDAPEINDTLGWVLYQRNQPGQAVMPLQRAVARSPNDPTYHFHLGLVYAKLGSDANARTSLETALKLNPSFSGSEEARKVLRTLVY